MVELALERDRAAASPGTDARRVLQLVLAAIRLPDGLLALVVSSFIWVFGEAFGQILAGGATDPNSGPLLALALANWAPAVTAGQADGSDGRPDGKSA